MNGPTPVESAEDIDPRWMTAALRSCGFDGDVTSLSFAPIGTGQMADSFRFRLSVGASSTSAPPPPTSVVVKMQAADPRSREAGGAGAYEMEVRFYTELARTLSIRVPACYAAALPDESKRFALVLEDLAPAEQGDQLEGCNVDQARAAVVNLAGLHGPRWCDPALRDLGWLRRADGEVASLQPLLANFAEQFIDHYGSRVSKSDAIVLRAFAEASSAWLLGRGERFSVVHADYRLDNLLFATPAGGSPVAAVDWQTVMVGLPGRDLGYFLGNSLLPKDRRQNERALVAAYHEALLAEGVAGYSVEQCFDDYRYGQFHGLMITLLASMMLTHTDRGDEMFLAMSSRACEAIRDLDSLDLL
jgi:aminoglycoside phosphotransferase (APT) family kinase protein